MSLNPRKKERPLIELFLSEYDDGAYRGCALDWLEDHQESAVEVLATSACGQTLAIEHTLIQPFTGEKLDSHRFVKAFSRIEQDETLIVPERDIEIGIPVGVLPTGLNWDAIGDDVQSWIAIHRQSLPEGISRHTCIVASSSKSGSFPLKVQALVTSMPGTPGVCRIARYSVPENLVEEVARALRTKLPKLVKTPAHKRILLLERDQIFPSVLSIYAEIVKLEGAFPELRQIDEIWFANTAGLATGQYVGFWLIDRQGVVAILNFKGGMLTSDRDDRVASLLNQTR